MKWSRGQILRTHPPHQRNYNQCCGVPAFQINNATKLKCSYTDYTPASQVAVSPKGTLQFLSWTLSLPSMIPVNTVTLIVVSPLGQFVKVWLRMSVRFVLGDPRMILEGAWAMRSWTLLHTSTNYLSYVMYFRNFCCPVPCSYSSSRHFYI
jgi:hypothetical protein